MRSSVGYVPSYTNTAFKPETPLRPFVEKTIIDPIPIRPRPFMDETVVSMETQMKIETLVRERDAFKEEADIERSKNIELEKEFVVLRELI